MTKIVPFLVAISAILLVNSVLGYANAAEIVVDMPAGVASPGCETTESCFVPSEVLANVGDTVRWQNSDTAAHTVTSDELRMGGDGDFDSGLIAPDADFVHTFSEAGTFHYFCTIHPWMVGTVLVSAAQPITAFTDKSSYADGETIVISGIIDQIVGMQEVLLQIWNPNGNLVLTDSVPPVGHSYSFNVNISGALWSTGGTYTIRISYAGDTFETTFPKGISYKDQILVDLNAVNASVDGDNLMDAADKLLDIRGIAEINVSPPKKDPFLAMIDNTIYSYLIASTPGSVHEYPTSCDTHEVEIQISNPPPGSLIVMYSNATTPVSEYDTWKIKTTTALGESRCIPYLVRGATVDSGTIDYNGGSFTIDITSHGDGKIIVPLSRDLIDSKKLNGADDKFTVSVDAKNVANFKETPTETIRILEIPFTSGSDEIIITSSPIGPDPTVLIVTVVVIAAGVTVAAIMAVRRAAHP